MFSVSDTVRTRQRTAPPIGSVVDFLRLLWALTHELERMSGKMEATLGLTARQRLVIRTIGRFPGISAGALADAFHLDPSSLTPMLKRLQRRGLLERRVDTRDRRRVLFGLTAAGRALDVPSDVTAEASVDRALLGLPSSAVTTARDVLAALTHQLSVDASG